MILAKKNVWIVTDTEDENNVVGVYCGKASLSEVIAFGQAETEAPFDIRDRFNIEKYTVTVITKKDVKKAKEEIKNMREEGILEDEY